MDVVDRFNHIAAGFPENIAVEHGARCITYAELNSQSGRLARAISANAGEGDYIVTFLEPGIALVASLLGILKAGKVFTPIDPYLFQGRIESILNQIDVRLIVTSSGWLGYLDAIVKKLGKTCRVLVVDAQSGEQMPVLEAIAATPADMEPVTLTGGALPQHDHQIAYLYFTSGSTGTPKAILGRHKSLLHFITWESKTLRVDERFRVSLLTPQTFDPFLRDVFLPLLNGATLCIPATGEIVYAPADLLNWLADRQITVMHIIPSLFDLLLEQAAGENCFRHLRFVVLAGENLKAAVVDRFYELKPPGKTQLINLYGPTETTLAKLYYRISSYDRIRDRIPVGKPIDDTAVFILDEHGAPVPDGETGEIYLETAFMSAGYLNAPEETARCFVPHPLAQGGGALAYRTGDLGRRLPSGDIEVVGRTDFQIKIHGQRVEPGEIERALERHPAVKTALVHCFKTDAGAQILAAYLQLRGEEEPSPAQIGDFLKRYLPDYMLPSHYQVMDSLPLLHNGKINRKALPVPCVSRPSLPRPYAAPQTEQEKRIAKLWEDLLKVEKVGRHDSFFELGGRSLQAIQFLARLNREMRTSLTIADFFAAPGVVELAAALKTKSGAQETRIPAAPAGFLQVSPEQRRLWFFQQLNAASPVYNMPYKIVWTGTLDRPVLQRALDHLIARHEAFRSAFPVRNGEPVPAVAPSIRVELSLFEFPAVTLEQARRDADAWLQREASRPFDLSRAPLMRVALLRISPVESWLFVNLHHIIADAWSFEAFWREWLLTYQALLQGRQARLPRIELTFRDYAYWQQCNQAAQTLAGAREYWEKKLAGAPPLIQLPLDNPRPREQTYNGARYTFAIPAPLSDSLRALARQANVTLFTLLMAAFKVLLYRYTGQPDVIVAAPVANRTRVELEPVIGFLVNILVFRSRVERQFAFRDFLALERETILEAFRYQEIPFDELVQQLQPERHLSYTPLFQLMFAFQEATAAEVNLHGARIGQPELLDNGTAKYDLTLQIREGSAGFEAEFEYATDLFRAATIERLAANFQVLLSGIAERPDAPVSRLPILSAAERQLLLKWNETDKPFNSLLRIHELIAAQAQKTPASPAVVFEGEHLTYEQLDRESNRLAHYLIECGVSVGTPVAISIERSLSLVIGFLGTLKAGAIYVPVDPDYPLPRRQFMLRDSAAAVLLTQSKYCGHYRAPGLHCVAIDEDWPAICRADPTPPAVAVAEQDPAYIIYTSGSTGQPKGVEIPHRGICNLAAEEVGLLAIGEGSRVLQFASFSFDTSIWEIVMTLSSGACLVMAERLALLPGPDLLHLLKRQRVTHVTLPASALAALPPDPLPALQVLAVAGEACGLDLVRQWARGRRFVNSYGPTETTVSATNAVLAPDAAVAHIGRPLANTRVWVLDVEMQQVPVGVAGELYIGGIGLARGYVNRPELTAERFIDNPHSARRGEKVYKTGDLVRYLADGNLEFLGRVDQQVKIRGFRIEPGEIEFALKTHDAVQDALVLVREGYREDKCLVAYVVPRPGAALSQATLRDHARANLPDYMLPAAVVFLDAFPRLPNNKIDRSRLPVPAPVAPAPAFVEPAGATEQAIASVWREVLRLERIGATQSFFELGGHSLLAARAVSLLQSRHGILLSVREFFSNSTVRGLAAVAGNRAQAAAEVLQPVPENTLVPLSFAQQRLWFLSQLQWRSPHYNICTIKRFEGQVDTEILIASIRHLLDHQSIFRHQFVVEEGVPLQRLQPRPQPLAVETLAGETDAGWQAAVQERAAALAATTFDLRAGPLYRLVLFTGSAGRVALVFAIHHILVDEYSLDLLDRQLLSVYSALKAGRPAPEGPAVRYIDFANWERRHYSRTRYADQLAYWKKRFAEAPAVLPLPFDDDAKAPRPADHGGEVLPLCLPASVCRALTAAARERELTPFILLLAGFYALLYRYTGQAEICVGTPVSVRPLPALESTPGLFLNTLALKVKLGGGQPFGALLESVKTTVLEALDNKEVPFDKVVEAVNPERGAQTSPLFNTMFVFQHKFTVAAERGDIKIVSRELENGTAKFDLTVFMWEEADRFGGKIEFSRRFQPATIARLGQHLTNLYADIAANPGRAVSALAMLSQRERHTLLREWNRTGTPLSPLCAHQLFEAQVRRHPAAIAVQHGQSRLSYAELNMRANRLARYLRQRGAGRNTLVGICLPRGFDLVAALLGVLKAGAAYVPIDPKYPQARLAYIVEDAEAAWVLTSAALAGRFAGAGAGIIALDLAWQAIGTLDGTDPGIEVSPGDLAYGIYTSGSTGKPKGVLIEHAGLSNYLAFALRAYRVEAGSGCPVHSSIAFDATITSLYTPLLAGRLLLLVDEENEIQALSDLLARERELSLVKITPAHLEVLSHSVPVAAAAHVRALVIGGEALNYAALAFWRKNSPGTRIINEYGPTETVVGCCVFEVAETGGSGQGAAVPIGRPIDNTRLYILDRDCQPVPVGVTGELYIGGAGVARGYHKREALTREKFIEDPFSGNGERLYRTGDLAKYLPDGNIVFFGRADAQVKIRGYRVEPGEVEACLAQHPRVLEAAVKVANTVNSQLAAYVVIAGGRRGCEGELRAYLAARLPEYMLPAHFVFVDEMPLTPHGKIDKRALPAVDLTARRGEYTAPRNEKEVALVEIWRQVLRRDTLGIEDNFFELGGDSILSLQIVFKAQQRGLRLSPGQLFEYQTIAALAAVAREEGAAEAGQGAVTGEVPLTPIQYWLFSHPHDRFHHFNQAHVFELAKTADTGRLAAAFRRLINHHDGLRATFFRRESQWVCRIAPPLEGFAIEHIPCPEAGADGEKRFIESRADAFQSLFDLAAAPLLKVARFATRYSPADRLLVVVHHLLVDQVSWQIIIDDLLRAYHSPEPLPKKSTSVKHWAERLQQYAAAPALAGETDYWCGQGGSGQKRLPLDSYSQVGHNLAADARKTVLALSPAQTRELLEHCGFAYRTRANELLLAALGLALAEWMQVPDIVVDLESHGRAELFADVDLSRTAGWFTALYPLALRGLDATCPGTVIGRVKEACRGVPHQGVGYGVLRYLHRDADVRQAMAEAGGAEVCFNYLGRLAAGASGPQPLLRPAAESAGRRHDPDSARFHILEVDAYVRGECLQVEWTYNRHLHRESTIRGLVETFNARLLGIIGHCLSCTASRFTPSDFPLAALDQERIDKLQQRYRQLDDIYPLSFTQEGLLFHSLFAPQAGVYFEQLVYRLRGDVDIARFKKAWQAVFARHAILRTAFVWKGLDNPLQIVNATAAPDWREEDWTGEADSEGCDQSFEQWLRRDRERGFDFEHAPLCRFALFKLGACGYRFVVSHHHLLLDGWSVMLVMGDVVRAYHELLHPSTAPAAEAPPYREYIKWQQGSQAAARRYWRETLRGICEPTPLPLAEAVRVERGGAHPVGRSRHPASRDTSTSLYVGRRTLTLDARETAALEAFARRHRITLSAVLQGAWALLLHRCTHREECLFGVTVSGRNAPLPGIESMVGLFINTMPVRVSCAGDPLIGEWLHGIQSGHLQSEPHAHISLAEMHRQSEVPAEVPLFDSIVVYENYPVEHRESGALQLDYEFAREKTHFPLTVVGSLEGQFRLDISYSEALYGERAVARIGRHLQNILREFSAKGECRLSAVQLLTEAERDRQLYRDNQTARPFFSGCAHHLFERQAGLTPDGAALRHGDHTLSYAGLNARANQLAHYLLSRGIGREAAVALCLNRSIDLLVAMLGVLKAGAAYIPIDPAYPAERIAFMLADAEAALLIQGADTGGKVSDFHRTVLLERDWPAIGAMPDGNPELTLSPDNLAYIIYTSGSTGTPKGVMIEHRGLVNYLEYASGAYRSGGESGLIHSAVHTSVSFDATITSLFLPLVSGGAVTLVPEANELDALAGIIQRGDPRLLLKLTPVHLELLGNSLPAAAAVNVETLVVGGEPLHASALRFWQQNAPRTRIVNEYGPTETVVGCCTFEVQPGQHFATDVPIGRPIANTRLYILDSHLNPVPEGVAGELYIGGAGVARGYLKRPQLTAQRFLRDPFGGAAGDRLYRTGDLVRRLPDGNLEFIGRIDQQIKLRGFRIELGEIEAVLSGCEAVREAAVILHRGSDYEQQRLVAFCVLREGAQAASGPLREYLLEKLPAYMLPGQFVFLPALPLTVNGKLDRAALRVPADRQAENATFVAPAGKTQQALCAIWQAVLERESIGVRDNFFALGGHSLKATRIVSRIDRVLGVAVPLRAVFEHPTIEELAALIDRPDGRAGEQREGAIKRISRSDRRSA